MKILAYGVSVIFHPLLILTYMLLLMLVVNPYMFGYNDINDAHTLILMVFLTSVLIPVIAIMVMKGIGWVQSLEMNDRHERIGPYLVSAVLYLSLYLHLSKTKAFPDPLLVATLGAVIAAFTGFFFNNFRKISMHAIAMGGFLVLTVLLYKMYSTDQFVFPVPFTDDIRMPTSIIVYAAVFFAGCIGTARLKLERHSSAEVYIGFILGILSMIISYMIAG